MIKVSANLYQGNLEDAIRVSKTKEVDALVWLSQEIPHELSHGSMIPVVHIPLVDGMNEDLRVVLAFDTISFLILDDKTLVACRSGISRSPTIVVAYLAVYKYTSSNVMKNFEKAFLKIHKLNPNYQPEPHLLESVRNTVKKHFSNETKEVK